MPEHFGSEEEKQRREEQERQRRQEDEWRRMQKLKEEETEGWTPWEGDVESDEVGAENSGTSEITGQMRILKSKRKRKLTN